MRNSNAFDGDADAEEIGLKVSLEVADVLSKVFFEFLEQQNKKYNSAHVNAEITRAIIPVIASHLIECQGQFIYIEYGEAKLKIFEEKYAEQFYCDLFEICNGYILKVLND